MTILNSDIFTLLTYEYPNVIRHYEAVPADEQMAVTAITRMEVLRGRTDSLLTAADDRELLVASARPQKTEATSPIKKTKARSRGFPSTCNGIRRAATEIRLAEALRCKRLAPERMALSRGAS